MTTIEISKINQNFISDAVAMHARLKTHVQLIQRQLVSCWKRLYFEFLHFSYCSKKYGITKIFEIIFWDIK